VEIDIPFHDLDGMNIVWHGHYYKYFEHARTAAMRSIHFDLEQMQESGYVWPVIETHCRYISSLKYGMKILVRAVLEDFENRVKFSYLVKDKTGKRLAKGHTVQAAVRAATGELCMVTPAVLRDYLTKLGH
jgi:acyl-CoA thioester hydrolase